MTAPARSFPYADDAAAPPRTSPGKFSGKRSKRDEVLAYRAAFAVTWQRFITETFDSPAHAAHAFHVDATTAEKWWRGLNAPFGLVRRPCHRRPHHPPRRAFGIITGDA